ncbi:MULTISPECIES: hypothetical protein [Paenibacillus]|uniref:hypothetical protein n=1 Tax=Paenibacillus TaxID=44249 RepID=UPI001FFE5CF6|nr:hypothetical protein [Paenibacillus pabuli]UPK44424.1 hypothetical protein KET34_02465 [Paenibacillus pabuli]
MISILIAGVVAEQLSLRMVYTVVSGVMVFAALGLWVTGGDEVLSSIMVAKIPERFGGK